MRSISIEIFKFHRKPEPIQIQIWWVIFFFLLNFFSFFSPVEATQSNETVELSTLSHIFHFDDGDEEQEEKKQRKKERAKMKHVINIGIYNTI